MSSRSSFLQRALAPKTVKVSVHFDPGGTSLSEQVDIVTYLKQQEVSRIIYAGDLKIEEIARLARHFSRVQGLGEAEILREIPTVLKKITSRPSAEPNSTKYSKDILRFMRTLEVIDDEFYLTLDGERLCRYLETDRQRYLDYSAKLLLTRAGWVAVVRELDQLRRGLFYAASQTLLMDTLMDNLKASGLMKRNDSWRVDALINCLVSLRILKHWDAVQKRFDVDLNRLYDVLVRKTFT